MSAGNPSTRTLLSIAVGFTYSLRQQLEGVLVAIQNALHLGWIHLRTAAAQGGIVSGKLATIHYTPSRANLLTIYSSGRGVSVPQLSTHTSRSNSLTPYSSERGQCWSATRNAFHLGRIYLQTVIAKGGGVSRQLSTHIPPSISRIHLQAAAAKEGSVSR